MFTDEGRLRAWLEILATLAEAQAEVGLVPVSGRRGDPQHDRVLAAGSERGR